MIEPLKLLLMFVNETDTWNNAPLYHAIVHRLRQLNIAGATAQTGILGFGHHQRLHHKGLFGIADDRPVTIIAVDDESKIRAVLPELREMVREGLILMLNAELVADQPPHAP
jgi:PII-like signaling protein